MQFSSEGNFYLTEEVFLPSEHKLRGCRFLLKQPLANHLSGSYIESEILLKILFNQNISKFHLYPFFAPIILFCVALIVTPFLFDIGIVRLFIPLLSITILFLSFSFLKWYKQIRCLRKSIAQISEMLSQGLIHRVYL